MSAPTLSAKPVTKVASPTTNMAMKMTTHSLPKLAKAALAGMMLKMLSATGTSMAVMGRGTISVKKRMPATPRMARVM